MVPKGSSPSVFPLTKADHVYLLQDGRHCQLDIWRGEATGGADRPASGVRAEKGENGGRSLSKLSDNDVSNFKLAKKRMFSIGGAKERERGRECKSEFMMRNITLTDKRKLTWQHSLLWLHVLHASVISMLAYRKFVVHINLNVRVVSYHDLFYIHSPNASPTSGTIFCGPSPAFPSPTFVFSENRKLS